MDHREKEEKVLGILKNLGVSYDYYAHEAIYTVEAAAKLDEEIGFEICKNLFLTTRHSTEFYLLLMQGHKKFQSGKVSKQVQAPRMTFGSPEIMEEIINVTPGSVSPLGLLFDGEKKVNFLIDKDVLSMEKISVHPCVNTATVVISVDDFLNKILPYTGHTYQIVEIDE